MGKRGRDALLKSKKIFFFQQTFEVDWEKSLTLSFLVFMFDFRILCNFKLFLFQEVQNLIFLYEKITVNDNWVNHANV